MFIGIIFCEGSCLQRRIPNWCHPRRADPERRATGDWEGNPPWCNMRREGPPEPQSPVHCLRRTRGAREGIRSFDRSTPSVGPLNGLHA
jgi:hypothetical protein